MTAEPCRKASILIVDDTIDNLQLMASMLKERGYEARPVPNGRLALQAVANDPPDLILLDINMPEMNGYEVCERLRAHPAAREIPVIFISALDGTIDKVKAFGVGGSDYVTKPFQYEEVFARLSCHLALRQARVELEHSYAALREAEQLRDSLVHMIVHDMRSPLSVLIANAYLLKQSLLKAGQTEGVAEVELLLLAGERLRHMAEDVLAMSRLEAGKLPLEIVSCDLAEMMRGVIESMRPLHPSAQVSIEAGSLAAIACDEKLVLRVVENLLSNALKHSPLGQPVRIALSDATDRIRVTVSDDGPGVPIELRQKIFEKFGVVQASRGQRQRSVGLGLALCRLAIEAHGGAIGVECGPTGGSTFWFTLPRTAGG